MTVHSEHSSTPSPDSFDCSHRLKRLFDHALEQRVFSGSSLLVATPKGILHSETYGHARFGGEAVRKKTWFDLASLTKPLITAPLWMWIIGQGELSLDDSLSRFFPKKFLPANKRSITVKHLLNHCSGLPPYRPFFEKLIDLPELEIRPAMISEILSTPLLAEPGKACHYSDLGFMLLGMILEETLGKALDEIAEEILFRPLSLDELGFCRLTVPPCPTAQPERHSPGGISYVATEICPWRQRLIEGEVHDENAYTLGGIAGHAGLFGTAFGAYRLLRSFWDTYRGTAEKTALTSEVMRSFWTRQNIVPGSTWALGFDSPSTVNSSAGNYFSARSIGHLGFTGTSFWLDLDREILVILLTNRVHPTRENNRMKAFRPLLHNLVMEIFYGLERN
ncbi:MAG: serine hydrolase domain-containing protein [Syntrophobacteraceae bacterium]